MSTVTHGQGFEVSGESERLLCVLSGSVYFCLINTRTCFRVHISARAVLCAGLSGLNEFVCEWDSMTQVVGFLGLRHKKRI